MDIVHLIKIEIRIRSYVKCILTVILSMLIKCPMDKVVIKIQIFFVPQSLSNKNQQYLKVILVEMSSKHVLKATNNELNLGCK